MNPGAHSTGCPPPNFLGVISTGPGLALKDQGDGPVMGDFQAKEGDFRVHQGWEGVEPAATLT